METTQFVTFGWFGAVCAVIAAKWAADMGFSQLSQLLWGLFAFVLPPVALLALYVRQLHQHQARQLPGGKLV